ncbi:MAG: type IV toxin-antitoxin system AbiEi family antitoxin [Dysgonamonadaceae bacterium]|jgi:predicted transcriptional regulator of viral defense system|nr:type IV toxin-antitoxin system AbiEi family antitoxin [Dysgonamonadaceae bacterium]
MVKEEGNNIIWNQFFLDLLKKGRYTFTYANVRQHFDLSENTLAHRLYVYEQKKRIVKIRKGFYSILEPSEVSSGIPDTYKYVDALMKYLNKPYYVALLSAAALHGAAHQQPMEFFIMTEISLPRNIRNKKNKITFFGKKALLQEGIMQKKSRVGYFNVSTPELTAFDLLDNIKRFGINRITTILQELYEEMSPSRLSKIAKLIDNKASMQRLGYILETVVGAEKLANSLYRILSKTTIYPVPLSPVKARNGTIDKKWKIIVNMEIEPDL